MIKKILTILVCGVLILGLTGCGDNSNAISDEDKAKVVREIESYIEQDSKRQDDHYKNSYEVEVTNIEIDGMKATFSGRMEVRYPDGSENNDVTFNGTTSIKLDTYSIYDTDVDYNY